MTSKGRSSHAAHRTMQSKNTDGLKSGGYQKRVTLDADHAGYEAGLITEMLTKHLCEENGVEVSVTLEVNAKLPEGMEQELARVVLDCVRTQNRL